jgi:hypothetical protein
MKAWALILLTLLITTPALAASGELIIMPPAQYDRGQYRGRLKIIMVPSRREMYHMCGGPAMACAYVRRSRCTVLLPSNVSQIEFDLLRRHELAHCKGWPADHRGGYLARIP